MADAASCASGQMYNGVDPVTKQHRFDRFYAIDKMGVEFSIFSAAVTESWNVNAHMWLKRYIFFRLTPVLTRIAPQYGINPKFVRDIALYLTYVLSAFWHGFYPIYFAAFVFYAVVTENFKEIYKMYVKYNFMRSLPFKLAYL